MDGGAERPTPVSFGEWLHGIRELVSLLMASGHPDAWGYTIGHLWTDAQIVIARKQAETASAVLLIRQAISTVPNMAVAPESTRATWQDFAGQVRRMLGE